MGNCSAQAAFGSGGRVEGGAKLGRLGQARGMEDAVQRMHEERAELKRNARELRREEILKRIDSRRTYKKKCRQQLQEAALVLFYCIAVGG